MERDEHCTHPEQKNWCDCDWCRLVRAHYAAQAQRSTGNGATDAKRCRNAARRERYAAMRSLGMVRTPYGWE